MFRATWTPGVRASVRVSDFEALGFLALVRVLSFRLSGRGLDLNL